MHLHVTLRDEQLDDSSLRVVVRLSVWDNERIRSQQSATVHEAYERLLVSQIELRERLASKHGGTFAVVSVFARPGLPGDSLAGEGAEQLREWLTDHRPTNLYGRYREAVIGRLIAAGHDVLPTDISSRNDDGTRRDISQGDHYDIVVSDLSNEILDELLSHFTEALPNPFRLPTGQ